MWLSAGAEKLWFRNIFLFESIFGIDFGLDNPIDERVADSILQLDQNFKLDLSDSILCLSVDRFVSDLDVESDNFQSIISIK